MSQLIDVRNSDHRGDMRPDGRRMTMGVSTRSSRAGELPLELAQAAWVELQILHSRTCLQLDHEYLNTAHEAHPVTLDRHQELVAGLQTRQNYVPAPAHE